jgi:hypothetical protein
MFSGSSYLDVTGGKMYQTGVQFNLSRGCLLEWHREIQYRMRILLLTVGLSRIPVPVAWR